MRKTHPLRRSLLCGCILALLMSQTVSAATGGNEKYYTYSVTIYAGNQGTFANPDGIQVDNHMSASSYVVKQTEGDRICITGLEYGDWISVDAQSCVAMEEDSPYYIGGIRESGRDNNTVSAAAFQVTADKSYVTAYGIKGDMVAYTVRYQDEAGNALSEERTFYGKEGDQPVVAFRYVENYQPNAYNMTKTLSSNEAENVFTFTYRLLPAAANPDNGGTAGNDNGAADNAGNNNGPADNAGNNNEPADNPADNRENDLVNNPDEDTPQDLVNLDDEDTPLADVGKKKAAGRPLENMLIFIGISVVAAAGLVTALVIVIRGKKKKVRVDKESEASSEKK